MKPRFLAALLLACPIAFAAESKSPSVDTGKTKAEDRAPALDALRKGKLAEADALLRSLAQGTPNSAAWHLDYAEGLMAAAIDLQDRDQYKLSTDYFHR